jgi:hypothetical protein
MPVVGVPWLINDRYTLEVGMPKTRLSYRIDSKWAVDGNVDLNGAVFRTSEDLGTKAGLPQYNNALATYRDVRLGVGTSYEFAHGLRTELETGYSVYREFDYFRMTRSGLIQRLTSENGIKLSDQALHGITSRGRFHARCSGEPR